jgi:hypothetical protein
MSRHLAFPQHRRKSRPKVPASSSRKLALERLEDRALLAGLPYGAMPDDTGEFMLGDVAVNVVLLESASGKAPFDASTENWTPASIAAIKQKVQDGVNWWKDSLDAMPNVRDGLLNFTYDWTYADNPVQTGYEPISRISNDFALWIYDFLNQAGFNQTGNYSSDIRAFNNYERLQKGTDWAFTIFVVNNAHEVATGQDGLFAPGGSFSRAFSFAGGRFMVVPADRPASTFAHETGHMFWAIDEYSGGGNFSQQRGYYNTQNSNAIDGNPDSLFVQTNSIMTNDPRLTNAYLGHTSSPSSLEMIGWKDSDGDGIFDVLDVPFTLTGSGRYDAATGRYIFSGNSNVNTLPNQNSSGLQDDITINRIRRAEYQIDNGPWQSAATYDAFQTGVNIAFAVPAGDHTVHIRTTDTRTGVTSDIFTGTTDATAPSQSASSGASGFAFKDDNSNGLWDSNEQPLADLGIEIVDDSGNPVSLVKQLDPNSYAEGAVLNQAIAQVTLTALGGDTQNNIVSGRTSTTFANNRVFFANSIVEGKPVEKWTSSSRVLRIDFSAPVSSVSLKAMSTGSTSIGRLEAYDSTGKLIARVTSGGLTSGQSAVLQLNRGATDIAYVIASGHAGTDVIFDDLKWGPLSSATTDQQGAYSLAFLPPGAYHIRANAPPGYVAVTPTDGKATVNVSAAGGAAGVNFAFRAASSNPWYNAAAPLDVNQDAFVVAQDALIVINYLNAHPGQSQLPPTRDPSVKEFVDVNNDGYCTALDALIVINKINNPGSSYAAGGEAPTNGDSGSMLVGGLGQDVAGASGESAPASEIPTAPVSAMAIGNNVAGGNFAGSTIGNLLAANGLPSLADLRQEADAALHSPLVQDVRSQARQFLQSHDALAAAIAADTARFRSLADNLAALESRDADSLDEALDSALDSAIHSIASDITTVWSDSSGAE